jgi:hypothetical protein
VPALTQDFELTHIEIRRVVSVLQRADAPNERLGDIDRERMVSARSNAGIIFRFGTHVQLPDLKLSPVPNIGTGTLSRLQEQVLDAGTATPSDKAIILLVRCTTSSTLVAR